MWHVYLASPAKPHYAALKDILNAYADSLAATIDRHSRTVLRLTAGHVPSRRQHQDLRSPQSGPPRHGNLIALAGSGGPVQPDMT